MAFVPWKDRVTSTPHRYKLTEVSADTYDLEAVPGSISEAGTPVNATNLNKLIQRDGDDIKDTVVAFTEASSRANIGTGESTATLFGKVKKWFTDLKAHAFTTPSATQSGGTTSVPSDKLLKESSFARVIRAVTELGLTYPCTTTDILNALYTGTYVNTIVIIGLSIGASANITDLPDNYGTLLIYLGSERLRWVAEWHGIKTGTGADRFYVGKISRSANTVTGVVWSEVMDSSSAQTISGIKTYSASPLVPTTPSGPSAAVAKSYADLKVALAGNETITGIKTFATGATPLITDAPTTSLMAVNKAYADLKVALAGNETISGVKTYSASPLVPTTPSGASAAVAKSYVDGAISNPTLVVNGDFFRNDSGTASFTSAVAETVNKWGFGLTDTTGSYTVATKKLKSNTFETDGKYVYLYQYVDNPTRLNGKTVTLSIKAKSTTGYFLGQLWQTIGGSTTSALATVTDRTLFKSATYTFPEGTFSAGDTLRVIFQTYGETVLDYAKLEIGSLATAYTPESYVVSTPYSRVIRTQAEFEALIADSTWLGATSVALVGQFTLSTENNSGIKIPATVKQIHGFNGAKITITNFKYNSSTAKGGMWYDTLPTTADYSIRDLEVSCNGSSGIGFYNCTNLTNCTGTGTGTDGNGYGFYNCTNLTNCTGTGTGTGETVSGYGFNYCTNLTNCTGTGTGTSAGFGFWGCTNLTNCTGTGTGTAGNGYGFRDCSNLTNCTGKGTGTYGYGFYTITRASNCKNGGSDTNMWGGTNKNIDIETCRKTPVQVTSGELTTLNT